MYVCMHACMHACMYVYVCIYVNMHVPRYAYTQAKNRGIVSTKVSCLRYLSLFMHASCMFSSIDTCVCNSGDRYSNNVFERYGAEYSESHLVFQHCKTPWEVSGSLDALRTRSSFLIGSGEAQFMGRVGSPCRVQWDTCMNSCSARVSLYVHA